MEERLDAKAHIAVLLSELAKFPGFIGKEYEMWQAYPDLAARSNLPGWLRNRFKQLDRMAGIGQKIRELRDKEEEIIRAAVESARTTERVREQFDVDDDEERQKQGVYSRAS